MRMLKHINIYQYLSDKIVQFHIASISTFD